MIGQVGGPQRNREAAASLFGFVQIEAAAQSRIYGQRKREASRVARKVSVYRERIEPAIRSQDRAGSAGSYETGTVVEDSVLVVILAGGNVERSPGDDCREKRPLDFTG